MTYKYTAYTRDKKTVSGRLEASSEGTAEAALYRAGYERVLSLREIAPGETLATLIPSVFSIKTRDIIDFSQQLASMFEAGLPILTALELLERQSSKAAMKKVVSNILEDVRNGMSFSAALGNQPQFPNTYCQVITASEQTGKLEIGLRQMAGYMEKRSAVAQKMVRTLIYPAAVLLMSVGVVVLMVTVALPPLVSLFSSLGARLPPTTRLLLAFSGFISDYKLYLFAGLLVIMIGFWGYSRLPSGKLVLDRLLLKLPVIGRINLESHMQQFCQIASVLLKAGLGLPQTISLAVQTTGNGIVRRALTGVVDGLMQGDGLSVPMAKNRLFPSLLVEVVSIGEQTGALDTGLATLADYYEKRIDQRVGVFTSLLEPLITLVVGFVVIFIALSIITPLYSILRSM
jgi:type IV pilus assembly protein PilC